MSRIWYWPLIIVDGDSEMREFINGKFDAREWGEIEYQVDLQDM